MRKLLLALALPLLLWAVPAQAVNCNVASGACFWIGGTGTWDGATDTAHWSNTTGGTTCSCEPTSTSSVTFDASSGGGTVTLNANVTNGSMVLTGFTGTMDFSANNNSPTFTGFSDASGTHTFNVGTGTITFNNATTSSTPINFTNASLTLSAASSTFVFNSTGSCSGNIITPNLGGKTFGTFQFKSTAASCVMQVAGANTFGTLTLIGPVAVSFAGGTTQTVSTALNITGTSGNAVWLSSTNIGNATTIAAPATVSAVWAGIRDVTFTTNTVTITNCFNLGHTSGVTCTAPNIVAGGGGIGIIGG
jgi:hypothetical protein